MPFTSKIFPTPCAVFFNGVTVCDGGYQGAELDDGSASARVHV